MTCKQWLRSVTLIMVLALSALAQAEPPTAAVSNSTDAGSHRDILSVDLAGRLNADAVAFIVEGKRRWALQGSSFPDPNAYAQLGGSLAISPAAVDTALHGEWQPHPALRLRLQYDFYGFLGESGSLLSFPSAESPFGQNVVDARKGEDETATGHRLLFQPTLAAKLGPVILRNRTDLAYYRFAGRGPYFFDQEYIMLLKDGDLLVDDRAEVLFKPWQDDANELYAGPFYEMVYGKGADLDSQRAGVALALAHHGRLAFTDRSRIYLQGGRYLHDRNRQNELFAVIGIGFDLDL